MSKDLITKININPNLINLLISRGIEDEAKLIKFLNPNLIDLTPISNYKGAFEVARRITEAIRKGEKILIYGDYDCDGICSVAMLYLHLHSINANLVYYIPNRHNDGYGINYDAVVKLYNQHKFNIMITVDCGISSVNDIDRIQSELNAEVIVTDHHLPPDKLPNCILFNPKLEEGFNYLSGAGVVLRIIECISGQESRNKYLDIAAIATIADIVPLIDDNRIIVSEGLKIMKSKPRKGLKFLADIAKARFISSEIAYKIAPRINASGRLTDANKVVQLFLTEDHFMLQSIVKEIDFDNKDRRIISDNAYNKALLLLDDYDLINNSIIILRDDNWDIGVLGIVAARLSREFMRPCILFTNVNNVVKGSGRSIEGINIYDILYPYKEHMASFGGHSGAVGLSISVNVYNDVVEKIIRRSNDQRNNYLLNKFDNDSIRLERLDYNLCKDIEMLEPFGCGNIKPKFTISSKDLSFTNIPNTTHIKASAGERVEIIGFNMLNKINLLNSNSDNTLVLDLNINAYNGCGQGIVNSILYNSIINNCDYYKAHRLKQLFYNECTTTKPVFIDSLEKFRDTKSLFGTLFIASDADSCYNVINQLGEKIQFAIGEMRTHNPINTLILLPEKGDVARYYNRLVFVGKPLRMGYIDKFVNKNIKHVYILNLDESSPEISISEDRVETIRQAVISTISKYNVKSMDEIYLKLTDSKIDFMEYAIVFYMMYEQKVLEIDKSFNIIVNKHKIDVNKSIFRSNS